MEDDDLPRAVAWEGDPILDQEGKMVVGVWAQHSERAFAMGERFSWGVHPERDFSLWTVGEQPQPVSATVAVKTIQRIDVRGGWATAWKLIEGEDIDESDAPMFRPTKRQRVWPPKLTAPGVFE